MDAPLLKERPLAEVESVEDLLLRVKKGAVRVPSFQRAFVWKRDDIGKLLDSIWRGYPIGVPIFWRKKAGAQRLHLGPLTIDAEEMTDAWWVVDGQQRLTSLAGTLMHPGRFDTGTSDDFAWYFDLERGEFIPAGRAPIPQWVPVNVLGTSVDTLKWAKDKPDHLARRAFEVSKALREYRLPFYLVSGTQEPVLRDIFDRLNVTGKALNAVEVFNALRGGDGQQPDDLAGLAEQLSDLQFGRIDEELLLSVLYSVRNLDVTRPLKEQARNPLLEGAIPDAKEALTRTIVFLKNHARIPHISLLPYRLALLVLARFFFRHATPRSRSLELLSRWLWRGAISGTHAGDSRAFVRSQMRAVTADEEASVQALLTGLSRSAPPELRLDEFRLQKAQSKIQMVAMLALNPRHLGTGEQLRPEAVLEAFGDKAFPEIIARKPSFPEETRDAARGVANRLFHEPQPKQQLQAWIRHPRDRDILASHGIDQNAQSALASGEDAQFLRARHAVLTRHIGDFIKTRAAWKLSDRPSLQYVLSLPESEELS